MARAAGTARPGKMDDSTGSYAPTVGSAMPCSGSRRIHRRLGPELPVAALVAAGLTNPRIAERLTLGTRTVRKYVEDVLQQLGFATRTRLGLWAAASGLYRPEADDGWQDGS